MNDSNQISVYQYWIIYTESPSANCIFLFFISSKTFDFAIHKHTHCLAIIFSFTIYRINMYMMKAILFVFHNFVCFFALSLFLIEENFEPIFTNLSSMYVSVIRRWHHRHQYHTIIHFCFSWYQCCLFDYSLCMNSNYVYVYVSCLHFFIFS